MTGKDIVSRVNICGTEVSNVSLDETMDIFDNWIENGDKRRVCVTPVNCILWANKNEYLQSIYNTSDLTLCDGVPLIWAASFLGKSLKGRVTGLDLFPLYLERCTIKGYSMFFLGAKEGIAELLKAKSEKQYKGIKILGTYSPPFAERFSEEENKKIMHLINACKPDILWVSLTAPKQDYWIYDNLTYLDIRIAIGVGGAFEVASGSIKRAPLIMQKAGLEWLYRFIKEPKRLFRRYIMEAPLFIPVVFKQWIQQRKAK